MIKEIDERITEIDKEIEEIMASDLVDEAKVYVNDKIIELTALEYRLLLIFASNKGILLTRQQILDKIILVKPLLICHQQILNLKCRNFAKHIHILTAAGNQNIFEPVFIKYLKKLKSLYHLTVSLGLDKGHNGYLLLDFLLKGTCQHLSINITDTDVDSCNSLQPLNCTL